MSTYIFQSPELLDLPTQQKIALNTLISIKSKIASFLFTD